MARVVFHNSGFAGIDHEITEWISDLGDQVLHTAQATCPVDSGALKASLFKRMEGKTAIIGATAPYAIYVEEGAGPHLIEPNSGEALYWAGAAHPVASVMHPGTPATHFLRNALFSAGA